MPEFQSRQQNEFFTSRPRKELPTDVDEMAGRLRVNMWKGQQWPYQELEVGDMLYWYDSTAKVIVWKTKVNDDLLRFKYRDKDQVRQQIHERFGDDPANYPYFKTKPDRGYCLAYTVTPIKPLRIPKPDGVKFPQLGWLHRTDPDASLRATAP